MANKNIDEMVNNGRQNTTQTIKNPLKSVDELSNYEQVNGS